MNGNLILWLTIGGSGGPPQRRGVGWDMHTRGWAGFVKDIVRPAIDRHGLGRILLHNPFGTLAGEDMQLDQYLHARDGVRGVHGRLPWLVDGFAAAWRPLTRDGVEVIAYMGHLRDDANFAAYRLPEQADTYLRRWTDSVSPVLDAGMSLGLDVASHAPADHPTYGLALTLRSLGHPVYVEPRPRKDCPHWFGWPIVTEDRFWRRSDPDVHADSAAWAARTADLSGEVVRFVRGYGVAIESQRQAVAEIVADGNTPAVELPYFA